MSPSRDGDSRKALCILCNSKKIDIANMGVSALVFHKSFQKHSDVLHKNRSSSFQQTSFVVHKQFMWWVRPGWSICACGSSAKFFLDYAHCHSSKVNGTWCCHPMEYQNRTFTLFVPIKCQLKPFFGAMFPDSQVAKHYTMNKNKVSYFVVYGIALVLKEERMHVIFFEWTTLFLNW